MTSNFRRVEEFMRTAGQTVQDSAQFPDQHVRNLRINLISEEFDELKDAEEANDLVEVADALTDLLYVIYGYGLAYGIDLDACFEEVHSSNMSKFPGGVVYRNSAGKIIKPPTGFREPNLAPILNKGKE